MERRGAAEEREMANRVSAAMESVLEWVLVGGALALLLAMMGELALSWVGY